MADSGRPLTSDALARVMQTNPVVVRRTLSGLREQGLVRSEKGHGGGWTLAADPGGITLRDVYEALGRPPLFAMGNRNAEPSCLVEQAVNAALGNTLQKAEELLLASFGTVTLSALQADCERRLGRRRGTIESEKADDPSSP